MTRAFAFLLVASALLFAGCGGGAESPPDSSDSDTTTYAAPATPDYRNADGSAPRCVTLVVTGAEVCNTDPEVVQASRAVIAGETTTEGAFQQINSACINGGHPLYECTQDAGSLIQLILFNMTNGLPQ